MLAIIFPFQSNVRKRRGGGGGGECGSSFEMPRVYIKFGNLFQKIGDTFSLFILVFLGVCIFEMSELVTKNHRIRTRSEEGGKNTFAQ